MSWDSYEDRLYVHGRTQREASLIREKRYLNMKIPNSLSYHVAPIDGVSRRLAIINSDNLDTKMVFSFPGEDLPHGGLVEWMGNHWLIIEKDANNEVYTRAKMRQCNYLLRWVSDTGNVEERWCIIEDGTKYLTGEYGDRNFIVVRGDSRLSMIIARDSETIKLDRDNRFLIDDYGSPEVLAYRLTKPFKLGGTYNEEGVLKFVLTECATEETDNFDLHIANYYKYFPRDDGTPPYVRPDDITTDGGKKVWL